MKKRFHENPRKRSQASQNRFRRSNFDEASDLINAKKVRFKEAEAEANHLSSNRFDSCSVQSEATEAPQSSSDAKTSEFAFFKKLKQDVGRTSRVNTVKNESIPTRSFRPSNNLGEFGSLKYKDVKSSYYVKKSETGDIGSFPSPKDAAFENLDMTSKVREDHKRFRSSVLIGTPTNTDLDSFLSMNTKASAKPETQCKDQDIFSFKREKLKQQIANTLFPEADELPKECDMISLLLRRLLPENCENTLGSLHLRQGKIEEESQLYCFPNPNIQVEENWETSKKFPEAEDGYFLGNRVSTAWSQTFRERLPSCQIVEDIERSEVRHVDRMLLGYSRNDEGSSLDDVDSKPWCNRLGDENLLMWRDESYEYSTSSWSKRFQERNLLKWSNGDSDYPTPCNTNTNILKHDVHGDLSHDGVGNPHSYKFKDRDHSYGNPNGHYGSITTAIGLRALDERPECALNDIAALSSDRWSDSKLSDFVDYAQPNHSYDFEIRRENWPLLLCWDTNESEIQDSSHANMELDLYNPLSTSSEDHSLGLESGTSMGIYSSSFSCSYKFQDHIIQKCAPLPLSYGPEELNPSDCGFFKNIFRDSQLFSLPQNLAQSSDSDMGLKFNFLNGFSEKKHDISADDVLHLQRQENTSLQFFLENENDKISRPEEDWCLMSVQVPSVQEVSLPLKLNEVRWMDRESETYYDEREAMTNYL